MDRLRTILNRPNWSRYFVALALIAVWLLVLIGMSRDMPLHVAGWITFLGLLITPGYLLGDIVTWRMRLDWIERLALALPLGVVILAIPGTMALLLHLTLTQLALGWMITSALVVVAWLIWGVRVPEDELPQRWGWDEIVLFLIIAVAFIAVVPTLNLYKIDGDAYAVNSFSADALAGLPLNETEPLFGTDLGPGVRMVFNQTLPLFYLWSHFSNIDPNTLIAAGSKAVIALWALFAAYIFGKAAGNGSRRFALFLVAVQFLVYLAAPFVRGDNVSLFFFERTNADKFMVPLTMLPVVFAFTFHWVRSGRRDAWLTAALATVAVSTIHPLIAAMLALALGAFGAFHLLFGLRDREVWRRVILVWGLIAVVMVLPFVQLFLSRGEAQLASSYPTTFEGWPIAERLLPVLPFYQTEGLDYYGPLPELSELDAGDAETTRSPILMWRFALNMDRQRLILYDINEYISDPSLILEPPYILALLLLPLLFWRIKRDIAAQFAVGVSLAVLFVMFNPLVTPLIGSFVMPWILWRFVWLLPYALIFALVTQRLLWLAGIVLRKLRLLPRRMDKPAMLGFGYLTVIMLAGFLLWPGITANIKNLNYRVSFPFAFPTPEGLFDALNALTATEGSVTVLADQNMSVTLPAFVAKANIVAHRTPTTSEVFPADQQVEALQRLIDQNFFFNSDFLTSEHVAILEKYSADYIITTGGSNLDLQMRYTPDWFEWIADDGSHSLYRVTDAVFDTATVQGNTQLAAHNWDRAAYYFEAGTAYDPNDWQAVVGMAEVDRVRGNYEASLTRLQNAIARSGDSILYYRLGQLYAELGLLEESRLALEEVVAMWPHVARFHTELGDVCLAMGDEACAAEAYNASVAALKLPNDSSELLALGDIWRDKDRVDLALPYYEEAVDLQPSQYNLFVLGGAYRDLGQFDAADALLQDMRITYPFSAEILIASADLQVNQENYAAAIDLYNRALWIQELKTQPSVDTRIALSQLLINAERFDEADAELNRTMRLDPYNAAVFRLKGDLYRTTNRVEDAIQAYQRAYELDPTQTVIYVALNDLMRRHGSKPAEVLALLQQAIEVNPDEPSLHLALGDQWQRLGDFEAAVEAYQVALNRLDAQADSQRQRPGSQEQSSAFAYVRLAGMHEDQGQLDPAMNYYQAAVAAAPETPWTQLLQGDALRRRNDLTGAQHAYENAIMYDADYVDAYVRLADLFYALGMDSAAAEMQDKAFEISISQLDEPVDVTTGSPNTVVLQAGGPVPVLESDEQFAPIAYYSAENNDTLTDQLIADDDQLGGGRLPARFNQVRDQADRTIQIYLQRIEQGERDNWAPAVLARYHKDVGDLYLAQFELDAAMEAYQNAIDLDPWWPEARLGLSEVLIEMGKFDDAEEQITAAVELAPGSVEAQIAHANMLDRRDQPDEALIVYHEIAQAHPGNERATLALARAWQTRERPESAARHFNATLAMNPGSADAYIGLAEIAMDAGSFEQAADMLQQALDADRQNINAYIRSGELAQQMGQPDEALDWFRQATNLPLSRQVTNITLLDALLQYGDYETALDYMQRGLAYRPDDAEILLRLGRTQRILGRFDDAQETLYKVRGLTPTDSRVQLELADLNIDRGRPEIAQLFYEQAIADDPGEATNYIAAGQLHIAQAQFDEAFAVLSLGIAKADETASLYRAIADLYLLLGDPDQALETLRDGIAELGETTDMLLNMGDYFTSRANFLQVEDRYNRALEADPDNAAVHAALGSTFLREETYDQALVHYERAVELDSASPTYNLDLANALEVMDRTDEAIAVYERTLALAPTSINTYVSLAAFYEAQGMLDDAQATFEQGLRMAPTSPQLLTPYTAFLLAQGDTETAMALLDQALGAAETADHLIARASVRRVLGQRDLVIADLNRALEIQPGAVSALLALGDLYHDEGDRESATLYYEQATELLPGLPAGYLRLGVLAAEVFDRDGALLYSDLARNAQPGVLTPPDSAGIRPTDAGADQ
ncbi:MAG: tetratricopeptide repeat protein [Anaerolineae bacterium]|nr:tetratricopeptide repeat protein [Anaerolineae bacterium]